MTHLNDVVALSIASTLDDVTFEFPYETDLLVDENVLESLAQMPG